MAVWECESDSGWVPYDAKTSAHLETEFNLDKPTTSMRRGKWTYTIDLVALLQNNSSTGAVRSIRRIGPGSSLPNSSSASASSPPKKVQRSVVGAVWECSLENGKWVVYDAATTAALDSAVSSGQHVIHGIQARGQTYSFDLQRLKQINSGTGVERDVRCNQAGTSASSSSSSSLLGSGGGGGSSGIPLPPPPQTLPGEEVATCAEAATDAQGGFLLTYSAGTGAVDFAAVTQWQVLGRGVDYDPKQLCPITADELGDGVVVQLSCSSAAMPCVFARDTVESCLKANTSCPSCRFQFSIPGPMPSGTMEAELLPAGLHPCEGFPPTTRTWHLSYVFPSGAQHQRMPEPGASYSGTSRGVFIPDTAEGRCAVGLLKRAFQAGHLFMVGMSVTTGKSNTVVWGGIHQKTSPSGGASQHGWPDPTYWGRLSAECANKGITAAAPKAAAAAAAAASV
mmetsp:Transcript_14591/g.29939  ORF Transcript_14591/g.29939 Transcript_14591/m.29939 type:complete len:453 (-) Transcript_14591:2-1360(-)